MRRKLVGGCSEVRTHRWKGCRQLHLLRWDLDSWSSNRFEIDQMMFVPKFEPIDAGLHLLRCELDSWSSSWLEIYQMEAFPMFEIVLRFRHIDGEAARSCTFGNPSLIREVSGSNYCSCVTD